MNKTLLVATLASALYAETVVEGPQLGHVVSKGGVRTVFGIAGASQLGAPAAKGLQKTVVLANRHLAVGVNAEGGLVSVNLRDGAESVVDMAGVSALIASPEGEAFLAISEARAQAFFASGARGTEFALPGSPRLLALADTGNSAAAVVAEAGGEALYILSPGAQRRVLFAAKLPAIAFMPRSGDLVVADESGSIYRIQGDLDLRKIGTVPGVRAIAGTSDSTRVVLAAGRQVHSIRLDSGDVVTVECLCDSSVLKPLGSSNFVLTEAEDRPLWVLSASGGTLRVAFVPEAANE